MLLEIELKSAGLNRLIDPSFHSNAQSAVIKLKEVPDDCHVYIFYFEGEGEKTGLKHRLMGWGEKSGLNLCVSLWSGASPQYPQLVRVFRLATLPAIVVTATKNLALLEGERGGMGSGFARIDSATLLDNIDASIKTLEGVYNDMMRGDFKKALRLAHRAAVRYSLKAYLRSIDEQFVEHWKELGLAGIVTEVFGGVLKSLVPGR